VKKINVSVEKSIKRAHALHPPSSPTRNTTAAFHITSSLLVNVVRVASRPCSSLAMATAVRITYLDYQHVPGVYPPIQQNVPLQRTHSPINDWAHFHPYLVDCVFSKLPNGGHVFALKAEVANGIWSAYLIEIRYIVTAAVPAAGHSLHTLEIPRAALAYLGLTHPFQFEATELMKNPLTSLMPKELLDDLVCIIQQRTLNMRAWSAMAKYVLNRHRSGPQNWWAFPEDVPLNTPFIARPDWFLEDQLFPDDWSILQSWGFENVCVREENLQGLVGCTQRILQAKENGTYHAEFFPYPQPSPPPHLPDIHLPSIICVQSNVDGADDFLFPNALSNSDDPDPDDPGPSMSEVSEIDELNDDSLDPDLPPPTYDDPDYLNLAPTSPPPAFDDDRYLTPPVTPIDFDPGVEAACMNASSLHSESREDCNENDDWSEWTSEGTTEGTSEEEEDSEMREEEDANTSVTLNSYVFGSSHTDCDDASWTLGESDVGTSHPDDCDDERSEMSVEIGPVNGHVFPVQSRTDENEFQKLFSNSGSLHMSFRN
jgi:hypothetical protein